MIKREERLKRPLERAAMLLATLLATGTAGAQEGPSPATASETQATAGDAPQPAQAPTQAEMVPLSVEADGQVAAPDVPQEAASPEGGADATGAAGWGDLSDMSEQTEDVPVFRTKLYGFIDSHLEKVAKTPDSVNERGNTEYAFNPYEIDIPNLNVMVQGSIYDKYKIFLNLASPGSGSNIDDEPVVVRNAWVEAPLYRSYLNLRFGKTYRRFGLYNEILDAVPTFIGIEAPELFDKDHLIVTRTTNLMLHGSFDLGAAILNYSLTTGQEERAERSVPIGADVYVDLPFGVKLGSSFYTTGGKALPSRAVGDGSPRGGVVNWMAEDEFVVFGGYAQLKQWNLILQAEYWQAEHDGTRDAAAVSQLADAGLNPAQRRRFFTGGDPAAAPITSAKYTIRTFYLRAGYEIALGERASITPYAQFDYYSNPETINAKAYGGDNEAGLTDDGRFEKYTAGLVLRPVSQVAFKVDGSGHRQQFNGKSEFYPEIRLSLAYLWELSL